MSEDQRKLTLFLYELMYSYLPPARIEFLMSYVSEPETHQTNAFLMQYASELADRLLDTSEPQEDKNDYEL